MVRYQGYIQDHPKSGYAWFQFGFQSLRSDDAKTALSSFQKSRELGYKPATSAYNIACSHARLGDKDAAFEWLGKAEAEDFEVADYAAEDEDLESLRSDPRFKYEAHHRGVHESLRDLHRHVVREIHSY